MVISQKKPIIEIQTLNMRVPKSSEWGAFRNHHFLNGLVSLGRIKNLSCCRKRLRAAMGFSWGGQITPKKEDVRMHYDLVRWAYQSTSNIYIYIYSIYTHTFILYVYMYVCVCTLFKSLYYNILYISQYHYISVCALCLCAECKRTSRTIGSPYQAMPPSPSIAFRPSCPPCPGNVPELEYHLLSCELRPASEIVLFNHTKGLAFWGVVLANVWTKKHEEDTN